MATLGDLRTRIHRILDDADETKYTDELIDDGINSAFDAIMPWCPKLATFVYDYTSGSDSGTLFDLPSDFYSAEAVYDSSGVPIQPATLTPHTFRGSSVQINDWLIYPQGQLSFSVTLTENVTLYYLAYWPKLTDRNSNVGIPSHLLSAICFYASAYCLIPEGISSAEIRQFNTKVDSGNPEHNPVAIRVNELLKLFELEIKRHTAYMRASRI
jgi:hypothetical protein